MAPNQNLRSHSAHALGSSGPTIACPFCPRHFRSRGGRTKHIRAHHPAEIHMPYSSAPPAPIPHSLSRPRVEGDLDAAPGTDGPQVPKISSTGITRVYHPDLDGRICDERGNNIPLNTPPPPRGSDKGSDDWTPYNERGQFELAEFLFRRSRMSAEHIDILLGIWARILATRGAEPTFSTATHLYDTIDLTPFGDVKWESFSLRYQGPRPVENIPPWMEANYDVCFRDPRTLVHNLLSNPDFESGFDYAPYQERTPVGVHRFRNFMSGNWAWNQADIIAKDPQTHGSVFCPIILGSDKSTVSVAGGDNEYWPIYLSIGNIHNSIRREHRDGVVVLGFLTIPKSTHEYRGDASFRKLCSQLVHSSLARILKSIKPGMTTPEVVRFPDGHFRKVIYGLGPYIADYPEQALLACIVQGWCPRCTAPATDLDSKRRVRRSEAHTEQLIEEFEPDVIWDEYGLVVDVIPFTNDYPRADIHESLAPDLLSQLIKGCFGGDLVTWVTKYIKANYPTAEAQRILYDIDRRISPYNRDSKHWIGDFSKGFLKVYLLAIQGQVPGEMTQTICAFLEFYSIAQREMHDTNSLKALDEALQRFYRHREVFRTRGVCGGFNLPGQHSLIHYVEMIRAFGALNGLGSSITESKHAKAAVKKLLRRSRRFETFRQMLLTNQRLDKLAAARVDFADRGMLRTDGADPDSDPPSDPLDDIDDNEDNGNSDNGDAEDEDGDPDAGDSPTIEAHVVDLAKNSLCRVFPKDFAAEIGQPDLPDLIRQFIYNQEHPDDVSDASIPTSDLPRLGGRITIYPSACVTFRAPGDTSGSGMSRQRIHAVKSWRNGPGRYDMVFVNTGSSAGGTRGLDVARVKLLFSYSHFGVKHPCALVHWFEFLRVGDSPDLNKAIRVVKPDGDERLSSVIPLGSIVRVANVV